MCCITQLYGELHIYCGTSLFPRASVSGWAANSAGLGARNETGLERGSGGGGGWFGGGTRRG